MGNFISNKLQRRMYKQKQNKRNKFAGGNQKNIIELTTIQFSRWKSRN